MTTLELIQAAKGEHIICGRNPVEDGEHTLCVRMTEADRAAIEYALTAERVKTLEQENAALRDIVATLESLGEV